MNTNLHLTCEVLINIEELKETDAKKNNIFKLMLKLVQTIQNYLDHE